MVWIAAGSLTDDWSQTETYYQTNYKNWNGFVSRIAVLKQIIDIRAGSVFSSWKVKGPHDSQATDTLNAMEGRGDETFKLILQNMYKVAYICGDAYAEKIYDGNEADGYITFARYRAKEKLYVTLKSIPDVKSQRTNSFIYVISRAAR